MSLYAARSTPRSVDAASSRPSGRSIAWEIQLRISPATWQPCLKYSGPLEVTGFHDR
jgi:hypothetical protein